MTSPAVLADQVLERARALGFDLGGVAPAEALPDERDRFRQWLADGRHATMDWLAREPDRRTDPQLLLPGARSVVALAVRYNVDNDTPLDPAQPAGRVARYARGRDYHRVLTKPLRKLARLIDELGPPDTRTRIFIDHGPIHERAYAALAGLGFIGKNTLLIHPVHGSWLTLAILLTTAELEPTAPLPPASCGDCRRCIDACPTGAIDAPWQLDARRCISYLTIEHEGPIEPALAGSMQDWVFGCDVCQDVCPYNQKRAQPVAEDPYAPQLVPARWSLAELAQLNEKQLAGPLAQSPVRRAGVEGLRRNAAIAAHNLSKDSAAE